MIPIEGLADVTLAIEDTDKDDEGDEDDEDDEEDLTDVADCPAMSFVFVC